MEVGVAVSAWYAPFYDLIQTALSSPHKVTIEQFYREVGVFLGIALIAVVISVLNNFFVSHYVFRWRTAMNEYYMANWQQLRHIEGAAQLCRKTPCVLLQRWRIWASALSTLS